MVKLIIWLAGIVPEKWFVGFDKFLTKKIHKKEGRLRDREWYDERYRVSR